MSGTVVVIDDGGPLGIVFGSPVASVAGFFTYLVPLTMMAYDASGSPLGAVVSSFASNSALSGDPGSHPNELLALSFPGIASVAITGDPAGGSFTLDDLEYVGAGGAAVPEPATLSLVALAAAGLALRRRPLR